MNNKIKNYLGVSLMVAALAVAYASVSLSQSSNPENLRSFTVNATGEAVAVPDIAEFTFSVVTQADTAEEAESENTEISNTVIEYLKDSGVADEDIESSSYNLYPRYERRVCSPTFCPEPEISGYELSHSVTVKVRETEKAGELLSGVISQGANNASQLYFTVEDESAVENEARAEAMEKAREKAESMADAGKFRLGKLLSISEDSYPSEPPYIYGRGGAELQADASESSVSLEPGSKEYQIQVYLTYEIK